MSLFSYQQSNETDKIIIHLFLNVTCFHIDWSHRQEPYHSKYFIYHNMKKRKFKSLICCLRFVTLGIKSLGNSSFLIYKINMGIYISGKCENFGIKLLRVLGNIISLIFSISQKHLLKAKKLCQWALLNFEFNIMFTAKSQKLFDTMTSFLNIIMFTLESVPWSSTLNWEDRKSWL